MPFDPSGQWFPPTTVSPSELHAPLPSGYPYQSLVPPFTAKTPGELLDGYYNRDRTDPDSEGVLRKQLEASPNYPDNIAAPTSSPGLVGKWERPNDLSAVPVPVYGADSVLDRPQVVVEFRGQDQKGPSTGVHLVHLCGKDSDPTRLRGAGDVVLDELRGHKLAFTIAWPGYQPEWSTIHVSSKNGGPLTRFDLGKQITIAYGIFFRKVEKERLSPSAIDPYNIALHQGQNGISESLGVQFMRLRLVRFRNTIRGSWVADVEIA